MPTSIRQTPAEERPRERCLKTGPASLSLRECLAIILGSGPPGIGCLGLATRLLERTQTPDEDAAFFIAMENAGIAHLQDCPGLGPAAQSRILAAFELGRRYAIFRHRVCQNPTHSAPPSHLTLAKLAIKRLPAYLKTEPKEWFGFTPVYASRILGNFCLVEKGARTHVNVDPAELFARILSLRPKAIILFHNHPSGHLEPSVPDRELTALIAQTAGQFGIQVLGHWIVGPCGQNWLD
jgi:DNA repair protein RadC